MAEVVFQSLLRSGPEIGANSYLLSHSAGRVLLDTGMHPKGRGLDALPDFSRIDGDSVDAVVVTHAHLDHCGSLPVALRRHENAHAYLTPLTAELAEAMLHNSCNVMSMQRESEGIKEYPLFTHREVDALIRRFLTVEPGRSFELGSSGMRAEFFDAGHLPGSAGVMLDTGSLRVFYTGDVHFENQTLSQAARFPETGCDVLIMECTRGAIARREGYTREAEAIRLAQKIMQTVERGGSVLMPVFAVGKTQEMLLLLHELARTGQISSRIPIHIGGLSTRMTQIIDRHADNGRRGHKGFRILQCLDQLVTAKKGTRDLHCAPGHIYALSSGMMNENTVSNDFAFRFIDRRENAVCFVGYADPASPAGALLRAQPGEPIKLHHGHPPVELKSSVDHFDFSGHATRDELAAYAVKLRPRKILLVHGDGPALEWMRNTLSAALPETMVIIPQPGERVRLDG